MKQEQPREDHDQIFKTVIKEFFKEFIELFLPNLAKEIDFNYVDFKNSEYFSSLMTGEKKTMDLIAKVKLKNGTAEYIYIHNEFQAQKPNPKTFPRRMFTYYCYLSAKHKEPIIPIVLFADDSKWDIEVPNTYTVNFAGQEYLKYFYHPIKLKHHNWKKFLNSNNPLAYALMAKMDYNKEERAKLKVDFLRFVLKLETNPARQGLLVDFIENYIRLNKQEQKTFNNIVETRQECDEVTKMITVYEERGIKIGREEGIQEGRQEGIQEGWQKGRQEGWQKGLYEGKIVVAKEALKKGLDLSTIAMITGLSRLEIENLQK